MRQLTRSPWKLIVLLVCLGLLTAAAPMMAQQPAPADASGQNPNANILFPLPVYVVSGQFPIIGSADAVGMSNYFLEFRTITLTVPSLSGAAPTPSGPPIFFPAVLPSTRPVTRGLLGTWDTTMLSDGLYELRLTVNVAGGSPLVALVGPLRVQNTPDPEVSGILQGLGITIGGGGASVQPTAAPVVPTAPPQPTVPPTEDPTPRGTVTTATANVRTGDGTNYPVITALAQGTVVTLVGISNQGTGWYQVQLPSGGLGWMSPSVLAVTGNVGVLPRVQPPPPPATPTFTPVPATPTPSTSTNLVAGNGYLNPNPPTCNQTFQVGIDIANLGSAANTVTGVFSVTAQHIASGTVSGSTQGPVPVIQPGVTQRIDVPLTIGVYFNEAHRITITIDPSNQIPETNKGDNTRTIEFTLQKGGC